MLRTTIDFEGTSLLCEPLDNKGSNLQPGDTYLAKRNTGWHLLTARKVDTDLGCVIPEEREYAYDFHECFKVLDV